MLAVVFVAPYMLLMSEVGSAFTQEGGPYEWTKMAFGRLHGGIAAILYWVTNPLWVGGSLAFIATDAWSANVFKIGNATAGDYIFKLIFIWISIGVAIISLRHGKWIPNFGAILRFVVLGFFSLTVIIYGFKHGVAGFQTSQLTPTRAIFFGLVPLLLFNYVGFELQNGAAEEMENPQKDVPLSVLRSGITGVLMYVIPIFCILLVLPAKQGDGDRRLHRRRHVDVPRRLRRRRASAAHRDDAGLHRRARHVGRGVDDRLRPHPGGRVVRRGVLPVLRRLQQAARDAGARERPFGHHVVRVLDRRDLPAQEREHRVCVHGGARHRDLDDADLVPVDLPGGAEAALLASRRAEAVSSIRGGWPASGSPRRS